MWMVGYNDHGAEFSNMADHPFNGRKLRPLIPRPLTSPNNITSATPSLGSVHQGSDFFSQHHNLALVGEHSKKEYNNSAPVVVSSRWNPTPEQLRALEELYRRGIRTPSAEQIQHITAQLRRFGKIEGKNVFYWFQNHKARERQKRRRQMESAADHTLEKKDLGASRTVFEVEQTKNWPASTNCSTPTQESVSVQRTAKAAVSERRTDGWIQFDEGELQQGRNFMERNGTWQMMQISCPPPAVAANSTHLINTAPTTTTVTSTSAMDPKLIKTSHDLNLLISPHTNRDNGFIHLNSINSEEDDCVQSQTLELFPLRSSGDGSDDSIDQKETQISVSAMNANLTPSQFFEFLPLKN